MKRRHWVILSLSLAVSPAGLGGLALISANAAEPLRQCWSPAELLSKPSEKQIRHTPYDPQMEPKGLAQRLAPLGDGARGSIRRVDLPGNEKLIALTFDLCENGNEISGYDGEIFDTLRRLGVKATFFASGKWLFDHKLRSEQLLADPLFEVGAHSWTHRNFRMLQERQINSDLDLDLKADAKMREGLASKACFASKGQQGLPPVSLFRFPFGTCNAEGLNAVNDAGLYAIQWDVVSGDPAPAQSAEAIRRGVVGAAKSGSIVVMHGNGRGWHTAEALPLVIEDLRRKGFQFATVGELLAKGRPVVADSCYEVKPGDNARYDKLFATNDKTAPKP